MTVLASDIQFMSLVLALDFFVFIFCSWKSCLRNFFFRGDSISRCGQLGGDVLGHDKEGPMVLVGVVNHVCMAFSLPTKTGKLKYVPFLVVNIWGGLGKYWEWLYLIVVSENWIPIDTAISLQNAWSKVCHFWLVPDYLFPFFQPITLSLEKLKMSYIHSCNLSHQ